MRNIVLIGATTLLLQLACVTNSGMQASHYTPNQSIPHKPAASDTSPATDLANVPPTTIEPATTMRKPATSDTALPSQPPPAQAVSESIQPMIVNETLPMVRPKSSLPPRIVHQIFHIPEADSILLKMQEMQEMQDPTAAIIPVAMAQKVEPVQDQQAEPVPLQRRKTATAVPEKTPTTVAGGADSLPDLSANPPARDSLPAALSDSMEAIADIPAMAMNLSLNEENMVEIPIAGRGWVFLEADTDIEFRSKKREEEQEVFVFKVPTAVDTRALFSRQNLADGLVQRKAVNISFITADNPIGSAALSSPISPEQLTEEEDGLVLSLLSAEQLEALAQRHEKQGELSQSLEVLDYLRLMYPVYQHNDRVSYAQARIFERPEIRNIRRSLNIYQEIVQLYPFSPYGDSSEERIRFIQRNILKVF